LTSPRAHGIPLAGWLAYWRMMRRYHRFEVEGLEHVVRGGPRLIVGYHGRAYAHDLAMLTVTLHERLGYLPHAVFHGAAAQMPLFKWLFVDGLGFVTGDGEDMAAVLARGEHVMITPGGAREGCRPFHVRYQVDWGERTGYLRVALKYGLPIVPTAASGVDATYLGLNDGYRTSKRFGVTSGFPLWLAVGATGLWPLSLPLPARIRQIIGPPIHLEDGGKVDPRDKDALLVLHRRVTGAVQSLLDRAQSAEPVRTATS
jgi:Diacylglycerol acyltransferase